MINFEYETEDKVILNPEDSDTPQMREMLSQIDEEERARTSVEGLEINVVDAVCGAGKTSAAINMINNSDNGQKFMYITPYLDEVKRIIKSCPNKKFKQPEVYGSKLEDIKTLLRMGSNIVSTHALFLKFDNEIMDLTQLQGYILVLDEVVDVARQMDEIKGNDLHYLLEYTIQGDNGILKWNTDKTYDGDWLKKYKGYIDLEALYYYDNKAILYLFPVKCFNAFREIYILTYMFEAQVQRCYYDFNKLVYKYYHVNNNTPNEEGTQGYKFVEGKEPDSAIDQFSDLINIVKNVKMNDIGEKETALSVSWYNRNKGEGLMDSLRDNMINFFKHIAQTPSKQNLWTTFDRNKKLLKGKGYTKSYLACNARATNAYINRTAIAYMCNRYFNPVLKNFFIMQGVRVEEEAWALSELLQFLFRSAIREGDKITVYIPSSRMKRLLENWINKGPIYSTDK